MAFGGATPAHVTIRFVPPRTRPHGRPSASTKYLGGLPIRIVDRYRYGVLCRRGCCRGQDRNPTRNKSRAVGAAAAYDSHTGTSVVWWYVRHGGRVHERFRLRPSGGKSSTVPSHPIPNGSSYSVGPVCANNNAELDHLYGIINL
uniref:Uncharacterized protein n=1 Tax=Phaeodactylum tricornutum TaxID=2850 RepID=A0A8J9SKH3_PHATR